jgi:dihydroflavonol-4-reductase
MLMSNFNRDLKSMRGFIGKTYQADVSPAMKTFNWKPYAFETTVLDTAISVKESM